jgi:hypothetical protein
MTIIPQFTTKSNSHEFLTEVLVIKWFADVFFRTAMWR